MTPEDHERVAIILGEDGARAWADALSREWPVSSGEIMEMHRKLDLFGVKSWRIPWLIQELLRGKRIVICCELPTFKPEKDLRREAWFDDLVAPMPCGPIKLRRRTIDVPEVAALLLPKGEPIRRDLWDLKNWSPLTDRDNPLGRSIAEFRQYMGR